MPVILRELSGMAAPFEWMGSPKRNEIVQTGRLS
jgi:hypothetical protein